MKQIRRNRHINNIRLDSRIPDNDLIIIEGCTENGISLRILVDNGSQAELISEQAARELNTNIVKSYLALITGQRVDMNIKGEVELNLNNAGHKFNFSTQVVSQLSPLYDVILGIGFLNNNYTCLKSRPEYTPIFCIGDSDIPIVD